MGKRVWENGSGNPPAGGSHMVVWNGRDALGHRVGSKLYIVRLTAVNDRGMPIKRLEQCFTLLH